MGRKWTKMNSFRQKSQDFVTRIVYICVIEDENRFITFIFFTLCLNTKLRIRIHTRILQPSLKNLKQWRRLTRENRALQTIQFNPTATQRIAVQWSDVMSSMTWIKFSASLKSDEVKNTNKPSSSVSSPPHSRTRFQHYIRTVRALRVGVIQIFHDTTAGLRARVWVEFDGLIIAWNFH